MNVDSIFGVEVERSAVGAVLKFRIRLKVIDGQEAPVSVSGVLQAPQGTFVAPLSEIPVDESNANRHLRGKLGLDYGRDAWDFVAVVAKLGRPELDYLQNLREKDPKGDLHLTLHLSVRCLSASAGVALLEPGPADDADLSNRAHAANFRQRSTPEATRVLTDGDAGYLVRIVVTSNHAVRIHASDWLHDFAPKLGLGKFAVFEIPQPDVLTKAGALEAQVNEALKSARQAEEHLREGEWGAVCEDLRGVWELLRNRDDIRDLLVADGYTLEAASELNEAFKNLFNLSSKFLHRLDRGKRILPEINPSKEDAYAAFTIAMAALNLIARKAKRHG